MTVSPPRPLRVLHLLAGSDAGGISRYVRELGDALVSRGHTVLAAGRRGAWHALFEQAAWPWIEAPLHGTPRQLAQARRTIAHRLDELGGIDLIHAHYRRASLVGRKLAAERGVPLLVSLHLTPIPMGPWRLLTDLGDHTLVASSASRDWAMQVGRVPAERVTCIPHGIDPQRWPAKTPQQQTAARASLGLADHDVVAAYVGRLDRPKNHAWLADVAAACRQHGLAVRVLVAGDGPGRGELERAIARQRAGDLVTLLGDRDPLAVYQAADLLLLPSAKEGFSLACAEAMSVGTAVLRTDTAGAAEQVIEGRTGRATPVQRAAFVAAAVQLLADREALRHMGVTAAQHVREHLSFTRQVERTEALYRALAPSRG